MRCELPPHGPLNLPSVAAFDQHYAAEHAHRCLECNANLPSAWLLELHQAEEHDPIIAAKRENGERTFRCFVSTCERVCSSHAKRRLHLIDKHLYPSQYVFDVVTVGLHGRTSLLRGSGGRVVVRERGIGNSREDALPSRKSLGRGRAGFWRDNRIKEDSRTNATAKSMSENKEASSIKADGQNAATVSNSRMVLDEKDNKDTSSPDHSEDSKEADADDEDEDEDIEEMAREASDTSAQASASTPATLAGSASPAVGGGGGNVSTGTSTCTDLDALTHGVQALRFVPLSVRMHKPKATRPRKRSTGVNDDGDGS